MYDLMETYISPLARLLYPDCGGDTLDRHHSFVVTNMIYLSEKLNNKY